MLALACVMNTGEGVNVMLKARSKQSPDSSTQLGCWALGW